MEHPLRHLSEERLVALYVHHRDRGESEQMREVWEELCVKTMDRVRNLVEAFHFTDGSRIPDHRLDDATSDAYLALLRKVGKLRGSTPGEFFVALGQWVWNACMDFGRRELRHDKHAGGSLDEQAFDEDGDRYRYDHLLEDVALERQADAIDKLEREADLETKRELLAWGIAQVENDNYREMLEMTLLERLPVEEIIERLGPDMTPDNVYARRSRGMKRLEEILRDRRP